MIFRAYETLWFHAATAWMLLQHDANTTCIWALQPTATPAFATFVCRKLYPQSEEALSLCAARGVSLLACFFDSHI